MKTIISNLLPASHLGLELEKESIREDPILLMLIRCLTKCWMEDLLSY